MNQAGTVVEELDDWEVLCSFLPEGWEQKARDFGALTRARGISGAGALLRILLIHIAMGCSLAETSVRAEQSDTPRGAGGLVSGAASKAVVPLVEAAR